MACWSLLRAWLAGWLTGTEVALSKSIGLLHCFEYMWLQVFVTNLEDVIGQPQGNGGNVCGCTDVRMYWLLSRFRTSLHGVVFAKTAVTCVQCIENGKCSFMDCPTLVRCQSQTDSDRDPIVTSRKLVFWSWFYVLWNLLQPPKLTAVNNASGQAALH